MFEGYKERLTKHYEELRLRLSFSQLKALYHDISTWKSDELVCFLDSTFPNYLFLFMMFSLRLYTTMFSEEQVAMYPFMDHNYLTPAHMNFTFSVPKNIRFCSDSQKLLIGIISHPSESMARQKIRESWAHRNRLSTEVTSVLFFVGLPDSSLKERLRKEMDEWEDIVIIHMEENYYSLPQKTLALLMFHEQRCPHVKCLVKADSDNVLHVKNLERLCKSEELSHPKVIGNCIVSRKVYRTYSKWAVPNWVYPPRNFPRYCSTGAYVFTGHKVVKSILKQVPLSSYAISSNFRKLPEDVLFSGIFPEMAGITRRTLHGFSFNSNIDWQCVEGKKRVYSMHMTRNKEPMEHFSEMRVINGQDCTG